MNILKTVLLVIAVVLVIAAGYFLYEHNVVREELCLLWAILLCVLIPSVTLIRIP